MQRIANLIAKYKKQTLHSLSLKRFMDKTIKKNFYTNLNRLQFVHYVSNKLMINLFITENISDTNKSDDIISISITYIINSSSN